MGVALMSLQVTRQLETSTERDGRETNRMRHSDNSVRAEFFLSPLDIKMHRELGNVRLSLSAPAEHLPDLKASELQEWLIDQVRMIFEQHARDRKSAGGEG